MNLRDAVTLTREYLQRAPAGLVEDFWDRDTFRLDTLMRDLGDLADQHLPYLVRVLKLEVPEHLRPWSIRARLAEALKVRRLAFLEHRYQMRPPPDAKWWRARKRR